MLELIREELVAHGIKSVGMEILLLEQQLETIKKFNESNRNEAIQHYSKFVEFMYHAYPKQKKTLEKFVDKAGYTVEHMGFVLSPATIDIQYHEMYLEDKLRDLKLVSRGLDESVLRYVTRLDRNSQKEQLDFYRDIKNSL